MSTTTTKSEMRQAYEGWEELPKNYCDNCWVRSTRANPVRFDQYSGRPLCRECASPRRTTA